MWKEFINNVVEVAEFDEPATNEQIQAVQKKFDVELPDELISLLKESDGVDGKYGCPIVFSTGRIIEDNVQLRKLNYCMLLNCLLFVADAGNGDYFGYSIVGGSIQRNHIYVWNHEDDSRKCVAPSLKTFIEWWNSGKIRI
ncbi:SUKH superfamily protein [Melghirimyces profundicolus]|uniref:SUKH superfamily protein n=1 Tax=Melghirimyces profundicolus TaxID=1242148 RepID=A0A2T6C4J9_9BACL|nr:SMI1/KNR4 family protein [Melghirimyces profundicolus]PTX63250.1 SUKH superfamily protein [Melghirimyces profundicolus]